MLKLKLKIHGMKLWNCNLERLSEGTGRSISSLEQDIKEGENPVLGFVSEPTKVFKESGCLGLQP